MGNCVGLVSRVVDPGQTIIPSLVCQAFDEYSTLPWRVGLCYDGSNGHIAGIKVWIDDGAMVRLVRNLAPSLIRSLIQFSSVSF